MSGPGPATSLAAGEAPALATLWDWRRRIAALYAAVRDEQDARRAWLVWRTERDGLFARHPQSPLEDADRAAFSGLAYFDYDPALRFAVSLDPVSGEPITREAGPDGAVHMRPFARTRGLAAALGDELTLFWIEGYGGGAFLPFADATSGHDTYGAGRYLLDTIKSADLGSAAGGALILDFNFSYNPSCVYSPRYVCPLAPRANRLPGAVRGGEKVWHPATGADSPVP